VKRSIHAEWTKLRTVPSNLWTMLALIGLAVSVSALVTTGTDVPNCVSTGSECVATDTTALAISGVFLAQLAAVLLGVSAVSSEYEPRLIRATFAANPRRTTVFAAKATVVAAAVLAAAVPGVVLSFLVGRAVLSAQGFTAATGHAQLPFSDHAVQRAAMGTVLYLLLVGLLSVGIAAIVRHTASAVVASTTLLYGTYLVTLIVPMSTHALHQVQRYTPMTAGLAVQSTTAGAGGPTVGPLAGISVLAAYAAAFLTIGCLTLNRRDA
jgi:ABC-2 type transport system permease protein